MADRAEAAQRGCNDVANECAVTVRQCCEIGSLKLLVERTLAAQHGVENAGGGAARGQARNFLGLFFGILR